MKYMKYIVPLAAVILLLMIAMPAVADDPFGGPPSKTSGNGTSTWAAIYVGGTWDNQRDANSFYKNPNTFSLDPNSKFGATGNLSSAEYDKYVTNWSAKITIPGGAASRWFKFDTVKSRDVEVYVDDVPKWGAAYRYFGTIGCRSSGAGDCDKADNLLRLGIDTDEIGKAWLATQGRYDIAINSANDTSGIWGRLYPPEYISRPSYFWPTPNNALLTTRAGTGIRIGDTRGAGGFNRGGRSIANEQGYGYVNLDECDQTKRGDGNTHLNCGKYNWDGWVYLRVFNYMIWDNDVQVGTRYTPNERYDFPSSNNPYPFNP